MKNGTSSVLKNNKRQREQEIDTLVEQDELYKKRKVSTFEVDVDISFIAERTDITQLHMAALKGNVKTIRQLIKGGSCVDSCDNEDETPLFYALRANKKVAFLELINQGSDFSLQNNTGLNIPCLALYLKFNNMIDKEFYESIKSSFGISNDSKDKILKPLKCEIKHAQKNALNLGKRLLIIIGEIHDSLRIYQIEKAIFLFAKSLGLSVGYAERPDYTDFYNPLRKKMNEQCGYTFYPVDKGRIDSCLSDRSFCHRERVMTKEIQAKDEAGIFVTGCVHLKGFFNKFKSSKQYHILPINLAPLENYELDSTNDRYQFAMDESAVLQVDRNGVKGTSNQITKKWSNEK